MIDASPAQKVKPVGKEDSRDRVLTDDELRAVWKATEGDDQLTCPHSLYQLLC